MARPTEEPNARETASTGATDPQGRSGPDVTDAPVEVGNTADLAEAERLEEDRAMRLADHQPDLPDRAFDRIAPQV